MIQLGRLITRAARHSGHLPALTSGTNCFTWRQVETRVWRIARALRARGVKQGDRVAYLGVNSIRYFEMYYAPSRIGAISVPLNFRLAQAELIEMLEDCTPTVLMADGLHFETARALQRAVPSIQHLIWADDLPAPKDVESYDTLVAGNGEDDGDGIEDLGSSDNDTAIIFYTGGTTGRGKGVMLRLINKFLNSATLSPDKTGIACLFSSK